MQGERIITDVALMEVRRHGTDIFPFQYYREDMREFECARMDWHWHEEFELVSVAHGEVHCLLGTRREVLHAGDGIFINAGRIHSFEAPGEGIIPNILFTPEFIAPQSSGIYEKYVLSLLASDVSHLVLTRDVGWQRELLEGLERVYTLCEKREETMELDAHAAVCALWARLYEHRTEAATIAKTGVSQRGQARLKTMTRFLEEHYAEKLTLGEIAQSANVSVSEALRCFQSGMCSTPICYLNQFRLRKAQRLLLTTEKTVTEIAACAGFESVGYFDRLYKREYGSTPRARTKEKSGL